MAWFVPSLADLRKQVRDHISARLPGADANIPNSPLRVISDNQAGFAAMALDFIRWATRQLLPDTAEKEWLDRHADIWLGGRKAGEYAFGSVTVSGLAGVVVPIGTRLAYGDVSYETIGDVTIGSAGISECAVRCLSPGVAGNRDTGQSLAIFIAVAGAESTAIVRSMSGGVDAETDDELRSRVLERIRKPPMGGDADDYVAWAKEVPGVTRAWCSPNEMGPGTVTLRFMMDDLRASENPLADGFPNSDDVEVVRAHLDMRRPVAVKDFFVVAPIPHPVSFTISGLNEAADNAGTVLSVASAVRAMLRDRAAPAFATNGVLQPAQTIFAIWVSEAALTVPSVDYFEIDLEDVAMPSNGHMAVLGSVTHGA